MTKAKPKAQKRRLRKQRTVSLPGGAVVTIAQARGPKPAEPPADAIALAARARLTGCTVEAARDVLASEDMGRCILYAVADAQARRDLLAVWQGISAAWANFCARCLSVTPSPQAAALPMLPEAMQTDPSLRVDLRTAAERDEAARRIWGEWRAAFNRLPPEQAVHIGAVARGISPPLWDAEALRPTRHGALAVKAIGALHRMRGG